MVPLGLFGHMRSGQIPMRAIWVEGDMERWSLSQAEIEHE